MNKSKSKKSRKKVKKTRLKKGQKVGDIIQTTNVIIQKGRRVTKSQAPVKPKILPNPFLSNDSFTFNKRIDDIRDELRSIKSNQLSFYDNLNLKREEALAAKGIGIESGFQSAVVSERALNRPGPSLSQKAFEIASASGIEKPPSFEKVMDEDEDDDKEINKQIALMKKKGKAAIEEPPPSFAKVKTDIAIERINKDISEMSMLDKIKAAASLSQKAFEIASASGINKQIALMKKKGKAAIEEPPPSFTKAKTDIAIERMDKDISEMSMLDKIKEAARISRESLEELGVIPTQISSKPKSFLEEVKQAKLKPAPERQKVEDIPPLLKQVLKFRRQQLGEDEDDDDGSFD